MAVESSAPMMERGGFWLNPIDIRNIPAVKKMNVEQFGAFIQLMLDEWMNGWVEADPQELADSLNIPKLTFVQAIWPRLKTLFRPIPNHPDRLVSDYISDQREQRKRRVANHETVKANASKAGKQSGVARRSRSKSKKPQEPQDQQDLNARSSSVEQEQTTDNRQQTNASSPTPSSPQKSQDDAFEKNQPAVRSIGNSAPADSVRYADSVRQLCAQLPQVALPRVPADISAVVGELHRRDVSLEIVEVAIWMTIGNWLKAWQDSAPPQPIRSMRYFVRQIDAFDSEYRTAKDRGMKTPLAAYLDHQRSRILAFVAQKTAQAHGPP
jgi:hypothetical protein